MSRLTIATSAQADASGGATFDGFGAPGTGTAWVVTAAVPLAPGTASFQAWRTTEVWATWIGSAAGGPLLVTGSQRLVVKGTSLVDTVTYRCVLTGQSMPETTAQGVSVAPISSSTFANVTNVTEIIALPPIPVGPTSMVSRKVALKGLTIPTDVVSIKGALGALTLKVGIMLSWWPTNKGKVIYYAAGGTVQGVSTNSDWISAKLPVKFFPLNDWTHFEVLGTSTDYVGVTVI